MLCSARTRVGIPRCRCVVHLSEYSAQVSIDRQMGQAPAAPAIRERLHAAFDRLLVEYSQWGGYRFHGWTDYPDSSNYFGPLIWSEDDGVLRFCLELEKEFPHQVHCEFSIDKATRQDWEQTRVPVAPSKKPGGEVVDIVVSDFATFLDDDTAQAAFRGRTHEAFVEVKWLRKGWAGGRFEHDAHKRVKQVETDLQKLAWHLKLGRCLTAAMLVFDDENFFSQHGADVAWPHGVECLICGPAELQRRGLE